MRLEQQLQAQLLRPIRVHICETELQLFGQVCSWHEKQLAQEMARDVAPTYRIRNELRIAADRGRRNRGPTAEARTDQDFGASSVRRSR